MISQQTLEAAPHPNFFFSFISVHSLRVKEVGGAGRGRALGPWDSIVVRSKLSSGDAHLIDSTKGIADLGN